MAHPPVSASPLVIGVTGNIAAGKSTVTRRLAELGATVIDADAVYHALTSVPGSDLARQIAREFGDHVLNPDGSLDRKALGGMVFADPARFAALDRLTHPVIDTEIRRLTAAATTAVVVVEAVKLVEAGYDADCDEVWLVEAAPTQQVERLMARNGLTRPEAERRVAAQPVLELKRKRATRIIDNSGDVAATIAQVDAAWSQATERTLRRKARPASEGEPTGMPDPSVCEIFFDFSCPYVYRAGMWVDEIERQGGSGYVFRWRALPLEQINADKGPDWKLWEQPDDFRSRGLLAFRAAEAAKRQGDAAWSRFRTALLRARHEAERDISKRDAVLAVAAEADLDLDRFAADLADRSLLSAVGDDFEAGRETHGAFGTPTFVFPNGAAAYVKLSQVPSPENALPMWQEFVRTVVDRPEFQEIKRPQKPTPSP